MKNFNTFASDAGQIMADHMDDYTAEAWAKTSGRSGESSRRNGMKKNKTPEKFRGFLRAAILETPRPGVFWWAYFTMFCTVGNRTKTEQGKDFSRPLFTMFLSFRKRTETEHSFAQVFHMGGGRPCLAKPRHRPCLPKIENAVQTRFRKKQAQQGRKGGFLAPKCLSAVVTEEYLTIILNNSLTEPNIALSLVFFDQIHPPIVVGQDH